MSNWQPFNSKELYPDGWFWINYNGYLRCAYRERGSFWHGLNVYITYKPEFISHIQHIHPPRLPE